MEIEEIESLGSGLTDEDEDEEEMRAGMLMVNSCSSIGGDGGGPTRSRIFGGGDEVRTSSTTMPSYADEPSSS
jgi:hypothetical protein